MAPRWLSSRQSAWGMSAPEPAAGLRTILITGVVAVLLAVGVGFAIGRGSGGSGSSSKTATVANPAVDGMWTAPKTQEGAVRAVTSFVSGFPTLAVETPDEQRAALDKLVAPTAAPSVRTTLQNTLSAARERVLGPVGAEHAPTIKLVTTPITYKVDPDGVNEKGARVQVWFVSILTDTAASSAQSSWSTDDLRLVWSDHWRIVEFTATDGPIPPLYTLSGDVSDYGDVYQRIDGFTSYRHATR